jgi:hypothetical protein
MSPANDPNAADSTNEQNLDRLQALLASEGD